MFVGAKGSVGARGRSERSVGGERSIGAFCRIERLAGGDGRRSEGVFQSSRAEWSAGAVGRSKLSERASLATTGGANKAKAREIKDR